MEVDQTSNSLKIKVYSIVRRGVIPKKPFPLTLPNFVIFVDKKTGEDICILRDYRKLDESSRRAVEQFLKKIYFMPRIEKIYSVRDMWEVYQWHVKTDCGDRVFQTRGRRSVFEVSDDKLAIIDVDKNVYVIESLSGLDKKSLNNLYMVI